MKGSTQLLEDVIEVVLFASSPSKVHDKLVESIWTHCHRYKIYNNWDLSKLSDSEFLNLIFNKDLYDEALGKVLKEYNFPLSRIRYNHTYALVLKYFNWLMLELEKDKIADIDIDLIDYELSIISKLD